MPTATPETSEARTTRRARRLGFLVFGVLVGVFAGGYFLDELPPDDADLQPPVPAHAEVDPFMWVTHEVPIDLTRLTDLIRTVELLGIARITAEERSEWESNAPPNEADLAIDAWLATMDDERDAWSETRRTLRRWFAEFEAEFSRSGGDPRLARIDGSSLGISSAEGFGVSRRPYPFAKLLGTASRLEREFGDFDQAAVYLSLALRIETWRAIYDEPGVSELDLVVEDLREFIGAGELAQVEKRAILEGLLAWEFPVEIFESRSAHHYVKRSQDLESDGYSREWIEGGAAFRYKQNRAKRRLGDQIRDAREHVFDPEAIGNAETSLFVKKWLDPYGDVILHAEFVSLHWLHQDFIFEWQRAQFVRLAIAIHLYERDRGELPTTLEELVPGTIDTVPHFPLVKRKLDFISDRTLSYATDDEVHSLEIPARSKR